MPRNLKLKFLGATGTVTGSRTLLLFDGKKVLVDCGLFQGPKELRELNWNPLPDADKIDAVVLTHAHIDHSGYLPKLIKEGFKGPIYCSEGTHDLCQIMLLDAAHLQEEDARYANRAKYSRHEPALPLFDTSDAKMALRQFRPVKMNTFQEITTGLGFQLIRSGHILGSSYVQFHYSLGNGSKILTFSGDIGNGRSHILKPPAPLSETDFLVMESTYGDRNQPRVDPLDEMERIINRVTGRGGTLVIPAFTVGRTQELLYLIRELESQSRIKNVPVYVDSPMALDATSLYLRHPEEIKLVSREGRLEMPFTSMDYRPVQSTDESMMLCMSTEPKIVISAAGMLTGGRILHHLKTRLPHAENAVLFVGYQAEGTKGRLLRHGLTTIRIHHQEVSVEAEILFIDSLSAHADSDDLIEWLRQLKRPPENIWLNHGEPAALGALRYRIRSELSWPAEIAQAEQLYELT